MDLRAVSLASPPPYVPVAPKTAPRNVLFGSRSRRFDAVLRARDPTEAHAFHRCATKDRIFLSQMRANSRRPHFVRLLLSDCPPNATNPTAPVLFDLATLAVSTGLLTSQH